MFDLELVCMNRYQGQHGRGLLMGHHVVDGLFLTSSGANGPGLPSMFRIFLEGLNVLRESEAKRTIEDVHKPIQILVLYSKLEQLSLIEPSPVPLEYQHQLVSRRKE